MDFLAILERIAPKSLEIDWDSLHMNLSALNIVFAYSNFASPPPSRSFLSGSVKLECPLQNTCIQPLKRQHPCEMVVPSGICKYIVPNVSCWINELRFVRSEPSNMHCCHAFPFPLAGLFLYFIIKVIYHM